MFILQITDTHLFKNESDELLGCQTAKSFYKVIEMIKKESFPIDCILLTGDLSQDNSPESYYFLAERLSIFHCPIYWLAGNHDEFICMENALSRTQLLPEKEIHFKEWSIILLNSVEEGKVAGFLSSEELERLELFLKTAPTSHVVVALHHHPIPVGCSWSDGIGLQNNLEFQKILKASDKVRLVLFGHIHQDFDQQIQGIRYMAAPSTAIQFCPQTAEFTLDHRPPGCRYFELKPNGSIHTTVKRVQNYQMKINYAATSY